jgi:hypothetical protein
MGMAKEKALGIARGVAAIAHRSGVLSQCETCGDYTYKGADLEDAYKLANALFSKKDPLVKDFATRGELTDAIKDGIPDFDEYCSCELAMGKEE